MENDSDFPCRYNILYYILYFSYYEFFSEASCNIMSPKLSYTVVFPILITELIVMSIFNNMKNDNQIIS